MEEGRDGLAGLPNLVVVVSENACLTPLSNIAECILRGLRRVTARPWRLTIVFIRRHVMRGTLYERSPLVVPCTLRAAALWRDPWAVPGLMHRGLKGEEKRRVMLHTF